MDRGVPYLLAYNHNCITAWILLVGRLEALTKHTDEETEKHFWDATVALTLHSLQMGVLSKLVRVE